METDGFGDGLSPVPVDAGGSPVDDVAGGCAGERGGRLDGGPETGSEGLLVAGIDGVALAAAEGRFARARATSASLRGLTSWVVRPAPITLIAPSPTSTARTAAPIQPAVTSRVRLFTRPTMPGGTLKRARGEAKGRLRGAFPSVARDTVQPWPTFC